MDCRLGATHFYGDNTLFQVRRNRYQWAGLLATLWTIYVVLTCHAEPARLTEHLRGTCKSEQKKKGFVHKAKWAKLPVGEHLATWTLLEANCPLVQIEVIQHALFHCKFVETAFQHISDCFPDWTPTRNQNAAGY